MHLGRFHATIADLAHHFREADLPPKLEQCAIALDQYAQSRAQSHLDAFRLAYEQLLKSVVASDPDLKQPYAQQVINELSVADILDPELLGKLETILRERGFDHVGIASDFRALATRLTKTIKQVTDIDDAFTELSVEFERVGGTEAEVGVMLPREVVGESLSALTAEFGKLGILFRAINELTGAADYDPKIRTISSSWWQIFVNLEPDQILIWVLAVERIVNLFKSNLEIKDLQQRLASNQMPKKITDLIEKEIEERVSSSLKELASELRRGHAKIDDESRLNEIETQLRQGLNHLAMRINQGSHVEINVGLPEESRDIPKEVDGVELDQEAQAQIDAHRARIAELRNIRTRARNASTETIHVDGTSQILLKCFDEEKTEELNN